MRRLPCEVDAATQVMIPQPAKIPTGNQPGTLAHPGPSEGAPPTSPSIIGGCSDAEYGRIEYGELPASNDMPVPQCLSECDNAAVRFQYTCQVSRSI
jgi:hypothetical protein